ncbi:hypothetical protein AB832_06075 [Flavobacteriaceae bacterium (ex Bugula neritina AB1)]|nr:hypothetical protein AB832_06075 [Flavobacteriaceae bacterium (ex Bugula neritina AB1)]
MKNITFFMIALLAILSCKEDDNTIVGNVNLEFVNTISNIPIVLNTESYTNQSNETYTISELKYIISNITLIKANGDEFKYPVSESFFLVNEEVSGSKSISLTNIPSGEYTKIKFGIGVDQSRYPLEGANFVPTAQESNMIWDWNTGFIFVRFEGMFTAPGSTTEEDFKLHIGSHGSVLDNYKEVTMDISNTLSIGEDSISTVSVQTDIAKIFDSTNRHSLVVKESVQIDNLNAPLLAENASTMFSITNVSN